MSYSHAMSEQSTAQGGKEAGHDPSVNISHPRLHNACNNQTDLLRLENINGSMYLSLSCTMMPSHGKENLESPLELGRPPFPTSILDRLSIKLPRCL